MFPLWRSYLSLAERRHANSLLLELIFTNRTISTTNNCNISSGNDGGITGNTSGITGNNDGGITTGNTSGNNSIIFHDNGGITGNDNTGGNAGIGDNIGSDSTGGGDNIDNGGNTGSGSIRNSSSNSGSSTSSYTSVIIHSDSNTCNNSSTSSAILSQFGFTLVLRNVHRTLSFCLADLGWRNLFHLFVFSPKPLPLAVTNERWNTLNKLHQLKYGTNIQDSHYSDQYIALLKNQLTAELVLGVKEFPLLHFDNSEQNVQITGKTALFSREYTLGQLKVQSKLYKLYRFREEKEVVLNEARKQYSASNLLTKLFQLHKTLYFQAVVHDFLAFPTSMQQSRDEEDSSSNILFEMFGQQNEEQRRILPHLLKSNIVAVTLQEDKSLIVLQ